MIRYLRHNEIDKTRWDLCLEQSPNALVYACSWYLDSVCPNWEALVLDDYLAIMPLTGRKKFVFSYLFQPFFTQQLGVFSKLDITQELLEEFIQAIPTHFRYVEIQLNEHNQILNPVFKVKKSKNFLLNLNKPYPKLQKGFNEQAKRNLKKARKHELEIKSISYQDVVSFYRQHKGRVTSGVGEQDYTRLLHLLTQAWEKKKLISKGVFNSNGELVASGVFLVYRSRILFLLGTSSESGRESGAMHFLFDHLILQFAGHGMTFDFEGSENPGIARFYKSFGAEKVHYYRLKINRLPWIIRLLKS